MPAEKRKRSPSPERFDTFAKEPKLEPITWEEHQKQMAELDKRFAEERAQEKFNEKSNLNAEDQKKLEELKKVGGLSTLALGLHPLFPNFTVRDRRT